MVLVEVGFKKKRCNYNVHHGAGRRDQAEFKPGRTEQGRRIACYWPGHGGRACSAAGSCL